MADPNPNAPPNHEKKDLKATFMAPEAIADLKSKTSIEDVARALGLRVENGRMACPHPERHAHGDRTPSVSFSRDRDSFRCWVCPDMRGDSIELIRRIRGGTFREAIDFLKSLPSSGPRISRTAPRSQMRSGSETSAPVSNREYGEQVGLLPNVYRVKPSERAITKQSDSRSIESGFKQDILRYFLEQASPVHGEAAKYLQSRRIFKRTWEKFRLAFVADYGAVSRKLESAFSMDSLQASGLFNADGHLRYYRHPLLLPYFTSDGQPHYLQGRAMNGEVRPKELSLPGPIPGPYNEALLNGLPGTLYVTEGVMDCLALTEAGFPSIAIPGASNFKTEWASRFLGKNVFLLFDPDPAGDAGAATMAAALGSVNVRAHRMPLPHGLDVNAWLKKGGMPHDLVSALTEGMLKEPPKPRPKLRHS